MVPDFGCQPEDFPKRFFDNEHGSMPARVTFKLLYKQIYHKIQDWSWHDIIYLQRERQSIRLVLATKDSAECLKIDDAIIHRSWSVYDNIYIHSEF